MNSSFSPRLRLHPRHHSSSPRRLPGDGRAEKTPLSKNCSFSCFFKGGGPYPRASQNTSLQRGTAGDSLAAMLGCPGAARAEKTASHGCLFRGREHLDSPVRLTPLCLLRMNNASAPTFPAHAIIKYKFCTQIFNSSVLSGMTGCIEMLENAPCCCSHPAAREEKRQGMPTAGRHRQALQDELPSLWSTGRFTDRNKCRGEICKSFLTVSMIQRSNLLTEVPLKNKRGGKGRISRNGCFHRIFPHLHIPKTTWVAFRPEGI